MLKTITSTDLFALTETHCSPDEDIQLQGFKVVNNTRKKHKKARKYSGGISLFIRNPITKGITVSPFNLPDSIWCLLDKHFFKLPYNVYIGFVYIPPANSTYNSEDTFDKIQKQLAKYSKAGKCILIGDMNGYTCNNDDYVKENYDANSDISIPQDYVCDVPVYRNNLDTRTLNKNGTDIIYLCKSTNMRIANGRKPGDLQGNFTCYDCKALFPSVIDYLIAEEDIFNDILCMTISSLTHLSDHCSVTFKLKCNYTQSLSLTEQEKAELLPLPKKYTWESTSASSFRVALNSKECSKQASTFLSNVYDETTINSAVTDFNNIIYIAADKSLKVTKRPNTIRKKISADQQILAPDNL